MRTFRPLLEEFIQGKRAVIIARAWARVAARRSGEPHVGDEVAGIEVFLDQLCVALRRTSSAELAHERIGSNAGLHGFALSRTNATIAQVVHDYGDICQTVTELAARDEAVIPAEEFKTLNLCLDDAIAAAVTEYARQRELSIAERGTERLGVLAHELRNLLNTASLSFETIKSGRVAPGGSTGLVLRRSLNGLSDLIDRSLADVRLDGAIEANQLIPVAEFIDEVEVSASLQAVARGVAFSVWPVDPNLFVVGDRASLAATLANLLQNALKFTVEGGQVSVSVRSTESRVFLDVTDECGGLPADTVDGVFQPFAHPRTFRRGMGLGLSICVKAAKLNRGALLVHNRPGKGCVFTLELPRVAGPGLVAPGPVAAGGETPKA